MDFRNGGLRQAIRLDPISAIEVQDARRAQCGERKTVECEHVIPRRQGVHPGQGWRVRGGLPKRARASKLEAIVAAGDIPAPTLFPTEGCDRFAAVARGMGGLAPDTTCGLPIPPIPDIPIFAYPLWLPHAHRVASRNGLPSKPPISGNTVQSDY